MNRFHDYLSILEKGIQSLDEWRSSFGDDLSNEKLPAGRDQWLELLNLFTERLKGNYPFHHPVYAGQMLKPPHPAAWIAYTLAATINPNNHALDGGPPTSEMEKEVIQELSAMVGYDSAALGHLTSGGTIANLEALWIARELHPGKAVASTQEAHYTHRRMCRVLNMKHISIPVDGHGNPDLGFLEKQKTDIGTVVVTLGTTGTGRVEPLDKLIPWAHENNIRIHIDAAYGGFYKILAENSVQTENDSSTFFDSGPWVLTGEADSIVIDPHKHGLQPYGCGSVLFKDASVGRFYKHDSPYTYFTSADLHPGEISLECSRAGASAAALWFTLQMYPLSADGLGEIVKDCRLAALAFADGIRSLMDYRLYIDPDLDIVSYFPLTSEKKTSEISQLSRRLLEKGMEIKDDPVYLSLCKVSSSHFIELHPDFTADSDEVVILRSVLMKPEHASFTDELLNRLEILRK